MCEVLVVWFGWCRDTNQRKKRATFPPCAPAVPNVPRPCQYPESRPSVRVRAGSRCFRSAASRPLARSRCSLFSSLSLCCCCSVRRCRCRPLARVRRAVTLAAPRSSLLRPHATWPPPSAGRMASFSLARPPRVRERRPRRSRPSARAMRSATSPLAICCAPPWLPTRLLVRSPVRS